MHQLLDTSTGNEKPQQDVDALIKNMVDEKVTNPYDRHYSHRFDCSQRLEVK